MTQRAALITGGTRGIGFAIAERFAADGLSLGLLYARDHARAEAAVAQLREQGATVAAVAVDVADEVATRLAVVELEKQLGERFTVLVNNAGMVDDALLLFNRPEQIDRLLDTHLRGAIFLAHYCVKAMIAKKAGVIINVISPAAFHGRAGQSIYAAAKGGLLAFTRTLAEELGPMNIRVNALSPGLIDTDMLRAIPAEVRDRLLENVPAGRLGQAVEVAAAAALLLRATYMSGAVLAVDGGLTS